MFGVILIFYIIAAVGISLIAATMPEAFKLRNLCTSLASQVAMRVFHYQGAKRKSHSRAIALFCNVEREIFSLKLAGHDVFSCKSLDLI